MKNQLPSIGVQIEEELKNLKVYLDNFLQVTTHTPFKHLIQNIGQLSGKQLRPRLVFIVAGAHGIITDQTRRGAALITLIHQASLLHDDVIDEACQRRGGQSVNATWGSKRAILLGDYLLTQCISLAVDHQDYALLKLIAQAAQAMTEGELLQLAIDPLLITEAACLEIIHKKTASLMGACSVIGTISSGQASDQQLHAMRSLGENLGMAFQIQDDLLDYGLQANLDKDIGMDIRNKKITLPLLYALQQVKDAARQEIINQMHRCQEEPALIPKIIDFVHNQGGIKQTQKKMHDYRKQALDVVVSRLPNSPYKTLLVEFIYANIQ